VTIGGQSRVDGTWVVKTVTWTGGTGAPPAEGWPVSGIRTSGLTLPAAPGWSASGDEGRSWQPAASARSEAPSPATRKVLAVQMKKDGAPLRYVYWLDSRAPLAPEVQFFGGWNPRLAFSGSSEALHRVTWTRADGKTQDDPDVLWGPVGSWKVPDGVVGARVSVAGLNALAGPAVSVGFAETGWSTPGWEPWDQKGPLADKRALPLGGRVVPRPGFWPVYEVSSRPDVAEPGPGSPSLEGAFLPAVPRGAERTFYVRFAWRDGAGLVGPATAVQTVRVNRVPPRAPEIQVSATQVVVKAADGDDDGTLLSWALTPARAPTAASLVFQPYTGPLDLASLRAGAPGPLWFHAQAQDRSGTPGPARLNLSLGAPGTGTTPPVVQVDPDPTVGELALEDGGVYPWPQFRLRATDAGRDLWVGVTDQAAVPDDWKARVQAWTGVVTRAVARGERRTFLVYWNAKTADGWAWPQPKTLVLTLDQGPPAAPVFATAWPSGPLGQAWTPVIRPGQPGDGLRYTFSLDGTVPSDPVAGDPWTGTRTWDAAPGEKTVVRLRIAAVSVSGLAVEMPAPDPVTIDRTAPPAVVPDLPPFSFRTSPLTIPAPGALVRYTVTSDGSLPPLPGPGSPAIGPGGLVLEGVRGQSVLYRFRWRAFSATGAPGIPSDTFSVLVDRTLALPASDGAVDPERTVPLPHLTGFPPSGVSAAAVSLKADWPAGVLRYEVLEGVGAPRAVTAQSPAWTGSLVLDGGAGVDRQFTVLVRGFTAEGRPLTEESSYTVRVDRQIPGEPGIRLTAEPRRPEALFQEASTDPHPDEVLEYRWSWDSYPSGTGQIDWQTLGTAPAVFTAPAGALTHLRVQAFLRDEAGNEGPVVEQSLLIDQNVVYASVGGRGDGSRTRPLGSPAEAVDLAHREGKSILFFTPGTFPVGRTLDLGGLQVYGGLAPDTWEATPSPGRSLWATQAPFSGTAFLESGDRPWSLARVDLASTAPSLDRVVLVRGAAVSVRDSSWNWGAVAGGWDQEAGTLGLTNVNASWIATPRAAFLDFQGGAISVQGLNLSATRNQGGSLLVLQGAKALFRDLVVVSKKAVDFDGICSVTGGQFTLDTARILAGDGAGRSTAFLLKDAQAAFWNTDVALYAGLSNTGFQATRGAVEVQKSTLSLLAGQEFNQGIVADHADAVLRTLQLKVASGSYQGGLSLDGGSLVFDSSQVTLAGGGQRVWGAQFLDTCRVTLQDVGWTLTTKTPGDLWKVQKPWAEGSSVTGSSTSGW
jgi:hypothetical protein